MANIIFFEPFYGGSHQDFVDGFIRHSRHNMTLVTLPARYWKWRMRGAGIYFAEWWQKHQPKADLVFASGLCGLSDFKSLSGSALPPIFLYCHENQLTYPLQPGEKRDFQFGFTDMMNCLVADRVFFNSEFHRSGFIKSIELLIKRVPDFKPRWAIEEITRKSGVLYPGCQVPEKTQTEYQKGRPVQVVWNHRWEHDKGPDTLLAALSFLKEKGSPFKVSIIGETFRKYPVVFDEIKALCGDELTHFGFIKDKDEYLQCLLGSDIVLSTALQENFGISIVEGVAAGCLPILPANLSYPELVPAEFHDTCLYPTPEALGPMLYRCITDPGALDVSRKALSKHYRRFDWKLQAPVYDDIISNFLNSSGL